MRARGFGPARCVSKVVGRQAFPRRPWCPSQPHDSNWLGRKEISGHGRIFPFASAPLTLRGTHRLRIDSCLAREPDRVVRRLANEYRAWERLCHEQAARAETELARQGLQRSAEYCRSVADDIEQADRWTHFRIQTLRDGIKWRLSWVGERRNKITH